MSENAQCMESATPFTQRVEVGSYYTDGYDLWEVVEVNPLGSVVLRGDRSKTARILGIDAFRRQLWLARSATVFSGAVPEREGGSR